MTSAAEAVRAAFAKDTNRIADPKMQMSKKKLLISHYLTRTHADYKSGHSLLLKGRNAGSEWIDSCQVVH